MTSLEKIIQIPRCYDSHVHWLGTGERKNLIDLSTINSFKEFIQQAPLWNHLNRGSWIVGFGWDSSRWGDDFKPHYKILDQFFPDHPVSFIRADGHSSWVNSKAMEEAGLKRDEIFPDPPGGRIERNEQGKMTGVFVDSAKDCIDQFIPQSSKAEMLSNLRLGRDVFLKAGFTHIRDVGGALTHWELAGEMARANELDLYVEMFFNLENGDQLAERLKEIQQSRLQSVPRLKVGGLKFYYDGALGSEGAYLSQNYPEKEHRGLRLYELSHIEEILHRCWEKNIPVAIHTLGDEAVHQVVLVAHRLKERGIEGLLNLEHCELVRDETIIFMRALNVHCHLQPSHFLSDRRWLKQKLGSLYQYCFPWKKLLDAGISVSFGSDSPIEAPSLEKTQEALTAAQKEGIELPPLNDPLLLHSHPDENWGNECVTTFTMQKG